MKNELMVTEVFETRFPGESDLAYMYYEMYRDAGPDRTLRALVSVEMKGKTRSLRQVGRWSSEYSWQVRVEAYDTYIAREACQQVLRKRRAELEKAISEDISLLLDFQKVCKARLGFLATQAEKPKVDFRELEALANVHARTREVLFDYYTEEDENA